MTGTFQTSLVATGARRAVFAEDGVQVYLIGNANDRFRRAATVAPQCLRAALALSPTILHLHDPELLPWAALLARRHPIVFDMHEYLPGSVLGKSYIAGSLKPSVTKLVALAERLCLRGRRVVFAEQSYRDLYSWIRDGVVVRNLPRQEDFEDLPTVTPEERDRYRAGADVVLGYFGSVTIERGASHCVGLAKELENRGVRVRLEIMGRISDEVADAVKTTAARMGFDELCLLPARPLREAIKVIRLWDWGLSLLMDLPNYRESLPTKLLEYLGCRVPFITTPLPESVLVARETGGGLVTNGTDGKLLTNELVKAIVNDKTRREMGEIGREAVLTRWTWSQEEAKLVGCYQSLLAEGIR